MNEVEPRFDRDLAYGKQGELQLGEYLEWIADRNGRVENKRKRRLDFELYVEYECDKGKTGEYQPSGIVVTTAEVWAYSVADTGVHVMIPTALLRRALKHKSVRQVSEDDGECPTHGYLVNLAAVLDTAKRNE